MANAFDNQLANRSFLYPQGFKFNIAKIPTVSFYCTNAGIPRINLPTIDYPNYLRNIPIESDVAIFTDLNLTFMVDEDMQNYMSIFNWIIGLSFPESTEQYKKLITNQDGIQDPLLAKSDGSLFIYNNNYNPHIIVKYKDLFPIDLEAIEFDSTVTDPKPLTAKASFAYTSYNILDVNGKPLWN